MKQINFPPVSIVIMTLNSTPVIANCLKSIADQDYPKKLLEVLLIDGGSSDATFKIARNSGLPIKIINGGYRDNQEARRGVALIKARNEIIAYIDSDNYLPEKDWLQKMVKPLLENDNIVGVQTLRYAYDPKAPLLSRYCALLGANDPVAYYLGKADRLSWAFTDWNLCGKVISSRKNYWIIEFKRDCFPTLGCNGFLVRKSYLQKAKCAPDDFYHTDVLYDLLDFNLNRYAIVNNSVYHDTGRKFWDSFSKRLNYMRLHYQKQAINRRYKVFDSANRRDIINLLKYVIYSLTLFKPLFDSVRGYLKIRDRAWFVHPLMCLGMLAVYSQAVLLPIRKEIK